jgi:suppressor of fused
VFGLFGRKKGAGSDPPPDAPPPPALGWEAIQKAFAHLYSGQQPKWWEHHGVHRMHDLKNPPENPLEAVAIWDAGTFWHYVSFGMSDLFTKESKNEWSGFGYEFTFRFPKDTSDAPLWPVNILVSLAKAAYTGQKFGPGHTIKTGPIDGRPETTATALLMVKDPAIPLLDTPHGKVALLLLVGVEGSIREKGLAIGVDRVLAEISASNPDLVTRV